MGSPASMEACHIVSGGARLLSALGPAPNASALIIGAHGSSMGEAVAGACLLENKLLDAPASAGEALAALCEVAFGLGGAPEATAAISRRTMAATEFSMTFNWASAVLRATSDTAS